MRLYYFGLLYFILISSLGCVHGENVDVRVQHFAFEEGLSSSIVHALYQDAKGFIWIGTDYGLNCFRIFRWELL